MTDPASKIVKFQTLETAEDLFRELSPATGDLWRVHDYIAPDAGDWVFRGSANGADGKHWGLLPSAHRGPDVFLSFVTAQIKQQQTGVELRQAEMMHVLEFARVVDEHGFIMPSDSHELRDDRQPIGRSWDDPTLFPPPHLVAIVALAQHHGIPTRLLDWTWKPLVAAYFAAEQVARRRGPAMRPPDAEYPHFSVFAVRRCVVEACRTFDPGISFLTVPTATNARLHAQGGIFSLVQPTSDPGDAPLPAIDEVLVKHAETIWEHDNGRWRRLFPLLVEFLMPVREARTVMLTLRAMGVSAATVFPGLDGVVTAMKEHRFYQWTKRGQRS